MYKFEDQNLIANTIKMPFKLAYLLLYTEFYSFEQDFQLNFVKMVSNNPLCKIYHPERIAQCLTSINIIISSIFGYHTERLMIIRVITINIHELYMLLVT